MALAVALQKANAMAIIVMGEQRTKVGVLSPE
jgi:hypothetical protein